MFASQKPRPGRITIAGPLRVFTLGILLIHHGQASGSTAMAEEQGIQPSASCLDNTSKTSHVSTTTSGGVTLVSIDVRRTDLESMLYEIGVKTGVRVYSRGRAQGREIRNFRVTDKPLREALTILAEQYQWILYQPEAVSGRFELWDQASYRQEVLPGGSHPRQKVFAPNHITAEEAAKAITGVLTPNYGAVGFDARSNKMIVADKPYVLGLVEKLLAEIDVALVTRNFDIRHAVPEELAEKLATLKGPSAPETIVDTHTRQITVQDNLTNIGRMERLVQALDIPTPGETGVFAISKESESSATLTH